LEQKEIDMLLQAAEGLFVHRLEKVIGPLV
jgi:hypothetical protein